MSAIAAQSISPLAPLGVAAAVQAATDPSIIPKPKIFEEFALSGRVGIVTGAGRGIGLESALAFCEAGAGVVYCLDLASDPSEEWQMTKKFVERFGNNSRLEYVSVDVTDQKKVWAAAEEIGDAEGRLDFCVAAAGITGRPVGCLEYSAESYQKVMDVNMNGVLFAAQAAGRQMVRFGNKGSIILLASVAGHVDLKDHFLVPYNTSKAGVIQLARTMACELGAKGIRVNSISPGFIKTQMVIPLLDAKPEVLDKWSAANPMGRIGRPDEIRGVVTWLASDASSYVTGSDIGVSGGHLAW